jgi:hypothetical protein
MNTHSLSVPVHFPLPFFDHLFAEGPSYATNDTPDGDGVVKLNGTGDSGGRRSSVKAPGGKDSRQQRDGG